MTTPKQIAMRIARGDFLMTIHAFQRQQERAISERDIKACGKTARDISWQSEQETWRLDGKDSDGFPLTVIAALEDDLLIVTVFRPEITRKKR